MFWTHVKPKLLDRVRVQHASLQREDARVLRIAKLTPFKVQPVSFVNQFLPPSAKWAVGMT
eukprot:5355931-Amphidinium_carterae.1